MFGLSNKPSDQTSNQIPYEVYKTVHESDARRRRWVIRLVAALAVVTLLIAGTLQLHRALLNNRDNAKKEAASQSGESTQGSGVTDNPATQGQGDQSTGTPSGTVVQSPQQNSPLPASGSSSDSGAQANTSTNDSTVRKPE